MSGRLAEISNEEWLTALKGDLDSPRHGDLFAFVRRIIAHALARRSLPEHDLDELAQESSFHVLKSLDSFRGDSRFTTWVAAIVTRVAFTEIRRRDARESRHAAFLEARRDALEKYDRQGSTPPPSGEAPLVETLREAIDDELTERQRIATLALLRGVPTIEIAEQLDSNQNAVYKLVHDARLRLRAALERRGVTADRLDEMSREGGR